MKNFFIFLLFLCCTVSANAQEKDSISRKSITIPRIQTAPKIDGVLDDQAWKDAPIATDFVERMPTNGRSIPDSLKTDVKIVYDDQGIYFGALMRDPSPEKILTELTERDNIRNDDFFFILLNGYNDRQQSLQFIVTAAGVQYDAKMTNMMEDASWNGIWYSAVDINEEGWVAEIFIPYSEIRFPDKQVQVWGLNMERDFKRANTRYSWSHVNNSKGSFSIYDGEIYGIRNIETPTRLSFQPYLSTYVNSFDGDTEVNFNGGMDLKYGINDAFTLDMILIPDFGQTRFDETVLNLSAFEVQYEEQRSFFTEGTELFSKGDLFYSRRIGGAPGIVPDLEEDEVISSYPATVDLINAVKISGRTAGGLGIGFFNAITKNTYAEVENLATGLRSEVLVSPFSNYNVFVLDQRFGDDSSISLVNTNLLREGSFRDANATGLYTSITNKSNTYRFWLNGEGSWVLDESTKFGTEAQAGFAKISGEYRFENSVDLRTKDYDINDMGYSGPTNYIKYWSYLSYRYLQPKGFLNQLSLNFNFIHERRLDPDLYSNFIFNFNSSFTSTDYINFGGGFETTPFGTQDFYEPRIDGKYFRIPAYYDVWVWGASDHRKKFAVQGTVDWYKYDEKGRGELILEFYPRYRVSDKFNLELLTNLRLSDKEEGFVTFADEEIIFGKRDRNTIINSLTAQYIFNNKMALNLAFRHYFSDVTYDSFYNLQNDGELAVNADIANRFNTTYNSWNLDLRYSWWFAPGSQLTFLYRNSIEGFLEASQQDFSHNFEYLFDQPQINSISLRLTYYLDYNRIKGWFKGKDSQKDFGNGSILNRKNRTPSSIGLLH